MRILITGGTVFVSRYAAKYFLSKGHDVYVLNRGTREQEMGVTLIKADRHRLGDILKKHEFDEVLDITAYNKQDVSDLIDALGDFGSYIFISSSAVYPETLPRPFKETDKTGSNSIWGDYGRNKIEAEDYLQSRIPNAYIIRPPYLYGEMNNLYREAFVFDCVLENRPFYLPEYYNSEKGKIPLQFFDVEDLCRFMEILLEKQPKEHIFNIGNTEITDVKGWVESCYDVLGKKPQFKYVSGGINQREYFPFYNYGYILDVRRQNTLMPGSKPLKIGLEQSYKWYMNNKDKVYRKNYFEFIDKNFG